jgi:hypothetical protein
MFGVMLLYGLFEHIPEGWSLVNFNFFNDFLIHSVSLPYNIGTVKDFRLYFGNFYLRLRGADSSWWIALPTSSRETAPPPLPW